MLSLLQSPNPRAADRSDECKRWPDIEPYHAPEDGLAGMHAANRRVVKDWLTAIRENRKPLGSGRRAMKALEMIHGIFKAGISGERVAFPLKDRKHPLRKR